LCITGLEMNEAGLVKMASAKSTARSETCTVNLPVRQETRALTDRAAKALGTFRSQSRNPLFSQRALRLCGSLV